MPKNKSYPSNKKQEPSVSRGIRSLVVSVFEKNPDAVLTHKQICALISANQPNQRQQTYDALVFLSQKGQLVQVNQHTFKSAGEESLLEGTLEITQRGFGFVNTPSLEDDVFIAASNIGSALNGDKVKFRVLAGRKGKKEGVIISVIERSRVQFAGTLKIKNNQAILYPDNQKSGVPIQIVENKLNGGENGMKAIVKVTVWPKSNEMPFGEVVALLGFPGTNDSEMISILVNQGFDPFFPQAVMEEAESISDAFPEDEIARRRDFRKILTFTIDPVDAKDFDDAISYQKLENGNLEIGVHIADVGHYVRENSLLDKEAYKRSNSVYLVDRVMPMLPEQLSNVLCSLRPNEDKFTFSAVFELSQDGTIVNEWFGKTIIHSIRRYAYEEVQEILEGKEGDYDVILREVDKMAKNLRNERFKSGALNIISEELRFQLNEKGEPVATVVKTSKDAHKLIEEYMLLANRRVAKFLNPNEKAGDQHRSIYRVHDEPDAEKLALLHLFCEKFKLELKIEKAHNASKAINTLLSNIVDENYFPLIQSMVIRSMAKATYSTDNLGHYGLAFKEYTHFTSPIRRYADLIVHRLMEEKINTNKIRLRNELPDFCKHISINERKATEAERESTKYFQTLLLLDHIGETFEGIISGFSEHGMFVKLVENHCEGMVSFQNIRSDRFYFDAEKYVVTGSRSGKTFNLGDVIEVIVDEVSPRKRQIDLKLNEG